MDADVPALPTDNLYKFVAIGGLLLVLVSNIVPFELQVRAEDAASLVRAEIDAGLVKQRHLQRRGEQLEKLIDSSIADRQGTRKPDPSKLELHYTEDEIKALVEKHEDVVEQREEALAMLAGRNRDVDRLEGRISSMKWLWAFGSGLGALMASIGFRLWYQRLQRHVDSYVQHRAAQKS